MTKRYAALVAVSAAAMTVFVGCSCVSSVENSIDDSNEIVMHADVTVSSASATTTTTAAAEEMVSEETVTTASDTSDVTTKATTTSKRAVQFVGRSEAQNASVTAKPEVVTQIVVVTVTMAPAETTTETVTETTTAPGIPEEEPLYTIDIPDGTFNAEQDTRFVQHGVEMIVGNIVPDISQFTEQVTAGVPENGGASANVYTCDGFDLKTEMFTYEDGSTAEVITEITITDDNMCTTKGVTIGDTTDSIFTAYGFEDWELVDPEIYRFRTENNMVMDFKTSNSIITEIRYYKTSE